MLRFAQLLLCLTAVFAVGSCGGAGGGITGPFAIVRVELPNGDPINILVGQSVTFVLAGYVVGTNQRVVLQADTFTVSNPVVGNITNSGQFTATNAGNATINATWSGVPAPQGLPITVKPANLAGVSGRVVRDANGAGIAGQQVIFFNAANVEVGRANTLNNGSFTAYVTTDAVRMNMDTSLLTSGNFLFQWKYLNLTYQAGNAIPNCHATFVLSNPPLVVGQTKDIPSPIRLYTNDLPPPVPDGCGP